MKHFLFKPSPLLNIVTLCAVLASAGCTARTPTLTAQEKQTMNDLTQTMQTHCIGRFLIDLPKEASIETMQTLGHSREVVIDMAGSMTLEAFHVRMAKIEADYKIKKHHEGWPYFYGSSSPSSDIILFERLESDTDKREYSRMIEGYKWSNNKVLQMMTKATDASDPKYQTEAIAKNFGNDAPQKKALITDLLERARGRDINDIPTEPGLCFDGGFVALKAGKEDEFYATFNFKKMPDVDFRLSIYSGLNGDTTLLERGADLNQMVSNNNGKVLHKGPVSIVGAEQVEEWLMAGDMEQGGGKFMKGHYFKLEGNSKGGSPQRPNFELVMENGGTVDEGIPKPTKASLSEAEALALWDAVSKTLRLRPGAL
ncbi:T6SS immunity protein Tli4 family protein [soil metagenome]